MRRFPIMVGMLDLLKYCAVFLGVVLAIGAGTFLFSGHSASGDWYNASTEPMGIAPDPEAHPEAIVQVYAARAFSWRGIFGVHTWLAVKPKNAKRFSVIEVAGWGVRYGRDAIRISNRLPDSRWYGADAEILADIRGEAAETALLKIEKAVRSYPYNDRYVLWPGPNSNTFIAHVARQVPELKVDLPPHAVGKDFIIGNVIANTPSGTGVQVSLFGVLGASVGIEEGVEVNILGLNFGIDPLGLSIKLPMAGEIGLK